MHFANSPAHQGLAPMRHNPPDARNSVFVLKRAPRSAMRLSAKNALFESGFLDGSFN
jgi:hypothetical protein